MISRLWWVLLLACGDTPVSEQTPAQDVDVLVVGTLVTPGQPLQQGVVAIDDGRIVAVVEASQRGQYHGRKVIEGALVTPGFVDAHGHVEGLGKQQTAIGLQAASSYAEVLEAVDTRSAGTGWLTGRGWDQNDWPDAPEDGWPQAKDLDRVSQGRPAAFTRVDGHAMWVNSKALEMAHISADTSDPEGGRIVRDAEGNPTGVLIDTAMGLVDLPEPDVQTRMRWIEAGQQAMIDAGLVGVHVMGGGDDSVAAWQQLADADKLRVHVWLYVSAGTAAAERLTSEGPWHQGRLHVVGVKAFADGALGSRGAHLIEPYSDEPEHRGLPIMKAEDLIPLCTGLLGQEAQLAVHAIGDQGVRTVLDSFEQCRAAHPDKRGVRLRVEHAQVVHPDDMGRFGELNAVASMQPTHATSDMPWAEQRLGPERIQGAYAWQRLRAKGALLALGSDFPVEEVAPALGMWSAMTRADAEGKPSDGWYGDQRLTLEQAVEGFTLGAARAVHAETRFGTLTVGSPGNVTVWTSVARAGHEKLTPVATIIDGEVVMEQPR